MPKRVLLVAATTEARAKAKMSLKEKWGEVDIRTAGFEHAVGVCKQITPHVVVVCPGAGGPVVIDELKRQMPSQQILRVGYDRRQNKQKKRTSQ